jgi:hypothetical protein
VSINSSPVKEEDMPAAVKTPEDEKDWAAAKRIVEKQYGTAEGKWGVVMKIFKGKQKARKTSTIATRVASRYLKQAGWWAISPDNPGLGVPPPVDKGGLLNAVPGVDPGEGNLYNGDGPADIMDVALKHIAFQYWRSWGRPPEPEELRAVFEFCAGRFLDKEEYLLDWFPHFASWLGLEPQEVTLYSSELLDLIRSFWPWRISGLVPYREEFLQAIEENRNFSGNTEELLVGKLKVQRDKFWEAQDTFQSARKTETSILQEIISRYSEGDLGEE